MVARRVLYWALWPLEKLCLGLAWLGRLCKGPSRILPALFIVSHPALLAFWIMGRGKRRREEDE